MTTPGESKLIRDFFRTGRRVHYQKNEYILRAGDEPRGVYLIESGLLKIYALSKQGNEHVTHFFGAGDFFPIIWLFRGQMRNVYYQALEPMSLWIVPKDEFMGFISKNQPVMREMLDEMVLRYLRYAGRIENLLYSDARERCAYRLLSLASRFGQPGVDGQLIINAIITQQDLAHSLNMTRETFGRAMSRFHKRGVISYDAKRHIIINDLGFLIRIIGKDEVETQWPALLKLAI